MNKKSQLKSAYIDGEMSANEYLDFEKTLSEKEVSNLKADISFEKALGEKLNQGPKCPDDLWQSLKAQMEERAEETTPKQEIPTENSVTKNKINPFLMSFLAAAAAVLITLSLQEGQKNTQDPNNPLNFASETGQMTPQKLFDIPLTLEEFKKQTLNTNSIAKTQQLFTSSNFNLNIAEPKHNHHKVEFIGAQKHQLNGEEVITLHYSCCDEPMKVIITCKGGDVCKHLTNSLSNENSAPIQSTIEIDKYRLALIGRHRGELLFDTITGPQI